jgi:cysteinyl-tRNA synthetase
MELKLYDTLTREKRPFVPIDPARVRMYVCGPTVYDFAHIGNARPVIVFDVLYRLLRHLYGADHVTYVRNITDVDDKINARAAERGVSIRDLTEETYTNFKEDVTALGCLPPTVEPRATEYIRRTDGKLDMIKLIERLVRSEHAYTAEQHVLFHVPSMPDYGQLSRRSLDEMIAGARVEVAPYKRSPMDFVLWKPSDETQTNYALPKWKSPCDIVTPGRPGWHIECSAMSGALLGETFDIHGGGIDLVFPHHENEIAQSRCAFHSPVMANYWMHNGFLQVEGEKMSKSLGNFVTIRELLNDEAVMKAVAPVIYRLSPESDLARQEKERRHLIGAGIRLNMLSTHYRQPINWTRDRLVESIFTLSKWYDAMSGFSMQLHVHGGEYYRQFQHTKAPAEFIAAISDDLNSPLAISRIHSLAENPWQLFGCLDLLGLIDDEIIASRASIVQRRMDGEQEAKVGKLVDARNAARKAKNFKESDRIRDELKAMGIELEDKKDGTTVWKVRR